MEPTTAPACFAWARISEEWAPDRWKTMVFGPRAFCWARSPQILSIKPSGVVIKTMSPARAHSAAVSNTVPHPAAVLAAWAEVLLLLKKPAGSYAFLKRNAARQIPTRPQPITENLRLGVFIIIFLFVFMFLGRKTAILNLFNIFIEPLGSQGRYVHVLFHEFGHKSVIDTQHVVEYQNLAVAKGTGANADGGNGQ